MTPKYVGNLRMVRSGSRQPTIRLFKVHSLLKVTELLSYCVRAGSCPHGKLVSRGTGEDRA